jgi:hypothetical protein
MNIQFSVDARTACPDTDLSQIFHEVRALFAAEARGVVHLREHNGDAAPFIRLKNGDVVVMHEKDDVTKFGLIQKEDGEPIWIAERSVNGLQLDEKYTQESMRRFFLAHLKI